MLQALPLWEHNDAKREPYQGKRRSVYVDMLTARTKHSVIVMTSKLWLTEKEKADLLFISLCLRCHVVVVQMMQVWTTSCLRTGTVKVFFNGLTISRLQVNERDWGQAPSSSLEIIIDGINIKWPQLFGKWITRLFTIGFEYLSWPKVCLLLWQQNEILRRTKLGSSRK